MANNDMILYEAHEIRKIFIKEEAKQIMEGTLDVTKFFEDKEKSTKRLMTALKGRPVYPDQNVKKEFMERASKLKEEVKAFREKYKI
jgi:hypothetical protein